MIKNDDIITLIRKQYADITEEQVIFLARRTLAWLTVLSNTASKRIADTKETGLHEWETRAVILASSVMARVLSGFTQQQSEIDSLNAIVDSLLTVDNEAVTQL